MKWYLIVVFILTMVFEAAWKLWRNDFQQKWPKRTREPKRTEGAELSVGAVPLASWPFLAPVQFQNLLLQSLH